MENEDNDIKIENEKDERETAKKSHSKKILIVVLFIFMAAAGTYFGINGGDTEKMTETALKIKAAVLQLGKNGGQRQVSQAGSESSSSAEASSSSSAASSQASSSSGDSQKNAITFESTSRSIFEPGKKGFFHFSKDGAKFYDYSKKQIWNSTYTMSSVFAVSKGEYTALGETQGRNIKFYTSAGEVYSLTTEGNITDIYVCETGEISVIMKCNDEYRIQVYSADGQLEFERYEQDDGVYPIKSALSSDGKILAVSYVDTEKIEIESKILLFYKDRNDSKNSDTGDFFAAVEKKGEIVPMASYSAKGKFIFIGDSEVFSVGTDGKEGFSTEIGNKIDRAAFTAEGLPVLAMGDELSGKEGVAKGSILFFDEKGNASTSYEMGQAVSYLKSYSSGVIAGSLNKYCMLGNSGKVQWQYSAVSDISDIIPLEGSDVLMVTNSSADVINIRKAEKAEEASSSEGE